MRLIDANKLGLTDFEIFMCDGDYKEALKLVLSKIDNAPAVDAEPVRHGRWEDFGEGYALCSECGETTPWMYASEYCGHCGAEMEGLDE